MQQKTITLDIEQARAIIKEAPAGAMAALIRANFTEEELNPQLTWEGLKFIDGAYIDGNAMVLTDSNWATTENNRHLFASFKQARAALAMAQLSQLMKYVNGDWKPNYRDYKLKHCIFYRAGKIEAGSLIGIAFFLSFKESGIRDRFLKDHKELIEEYFLMYQ